MNGASTNSHRSGTSGSSTPSGSRAFWKASPPRSRPGPSRFLSNKQKPLASILFALSLSIFTSSAWSKTKTPQGSGSKGGRPHKDSPAEVQPPAPSIHTAEELHHQLLTALREADWLKAANAYTAWLRDFGDRQDLLPFIASFRAPVALGLLQIDKLDAATPLLEAALSAPAGIAPSIRRELCFQRAACALRLNLTTKAREHFQAFTGLFPQTGLRKDDPSPALEKKRYQDALLLIAQCLLREGRASDAAEKLDQFRPQLDAFHASQAVALQFRALIESEQKDQALRFLQDNEAELQACIELLSTQSCVLKLGAQLLDSGKPRDALACLLKVRRFQTVAALQKRRLAALEAQITWEPPPAGTDRRESSALLESRQAIQNELSSQGEFEGLDASTRLRAAAAYAALERPLEAALILNEAARLWASDPALAKAHATLSVYWSQAERWNEAIEVANVFHQKWPKAPETPGVELLRGTALQKLGRLDEAVAAFRNVSGRFPKTEPAARARLMEAFTLLQQGNAEAASPIFEALLSAKTAVDLSEEASFGRCLAYSLSSQYAKCRSAAGEYQRTHPSGERLPDVLFQKARAAHLTRDYQTAIPELRAFLEAFPEHEKTGEAGVLLGDALLSENAPLEAWTAYRRVPADRAAYERAWFKAAPLFSLLNKTVDLKEHLSSFQTERPRSAQLADALLWVLKAFPPPPPEEETDKLVWELITQHGDHWEVPAVDTLLTRLCQRKDQPTGFSDVLDRTLKAAETSGQTVLQIRLLRAMARLEAGRPEESYRLLGQAMALAKPETTSPSLLADFGDALLAQGDMVGARGHWRNLLKWHPRAGEKDRALAGLACVAQANGEPREAMAWIERFEAETESSTLAGAMLLKKAAILLKIGCEEEANRTLETLLQRGGISGQWKSEALLELAEHHMRKGKPGRAIPYYQRIYTMYGRWTGPLARAYLRSGEAFEQLQDLEAARRTYREMLDRDLSGEPEAVRAARDRLQALDESGR